MEKLTFYFLAITLMFATASGQSREGAYGLPQLHTIKALVLTPSYSCRPPEEFQRGYQQTALFLSDYAKRMNSPELLFNGACQSVDYLQVSTAGDDMSLIGDLGADTSLEEISASRAFNLQRVHDFASYTKFAQVAEIKRGHTYVVVINNATKRGLFVFTVSGYEPNKRLELRYAVKAYQVNGNVEARAPGFDWEQKNLSSRSSENARNEVKGHD